MNLADTLIKFFAGSGFLKRGTIEFFYDSGDAVETYEVTDIEITQIRYLAQNGYGGTIDAGCRYKIRDIRLRRTVHLGTKLLLDIS